MAANDEHPFASIVNAWHESHDPTPAQDTVEVVAPGAAVETEPPVETGSAVEDALQTPAVEVPAVQAPELADPEAKETVSDAAGGATVDEPNPAAATVISAYLASQVEAPVEEAEPVVEEPIADEAAVEPPAQDADASSPADPILAAYHASQASAEAAAAEPAAPVVAVEVPDAEKPSALVDPSRSILAAYYAQSELDLGMDEPELPAEVEPEAEPVAADDVTEAAEPLTQEPVAEEPTAVVAADEPEVEAPAVDTSVPEDGAEDQASVLDEEPVAEPESALEAAVVSEPEPEIEPQPEPEPLVEAEPQPVAEAEPAPARSGPFGKAGATGSTAAAASVLAAYYADAADAQPQPVAEPAPVAEPTPVAQAQPVAAPTPGVEATAILPALDHRGFPASPSSPLGVTTGGRDWNAQALRAASASPMASAIPPTDWAAEDAPEAQLPTVVQDKATEAQLPTVVQDKATEDIEEYVQPAEEPSQSRRKFLMLAPIAVIAAAAVIAVLLWNRPHSDAAPAPVQSSTTIAVENKTPMQIAQAAYASALDRFTNAKDSGDAVLAGGAAHDTLKLLKDFKGATKENKALLAAQRAHLDSLSGLASSSPGGFSGAVDKAHETLNSVQKAAQADPSSKAPNSGTATTSAIEVLGAGNVTKLQGDLGSLIDRTRSARSCDSGANPCGTAVLRSVAGNASGDAGAARSLADILTADGSKSAANGLASQFSSMTGMSRINGDNLNAWTSVRPDMVSALTSVNGGTSAVGNVDTLIANAQSTLAKWRANNGGNGDTDAIKAYASRMRGQLGTFSNAMGKMPSLPGSTTCSAGVKAGYRDAAGTAAGWANNAANAIKGISVPSGIRSAHDALIGAINQGTQAATAAQNVTVLCGSNNAKYETMSPYWGTYSNAKGIKGSWGGSLDSWNRAVDSAVANASSAKPTV